MPRRLYHFAIVALMALAPWPGAAQPAPPSKAPAASPLYDPRQLPSFRGQIQLFTFTPRGDIDGFVTVDGTEVKLPPHLTDEVASAFKPGDAVTVHGLKAASLPLIQAMSVTNEESGRQVVDAGPDAPGRSNAPPREEAAAGPRVSLQGRIRMDLHGPRGDINGVLLEDGSVLKLPPPEAARLSALLTPGQTIDLEGNKRITPSGAFVDLTAVGPAGGPLAPIKGEQRSDLADRRQPA